jgi:hypothetical protein
LTLSVQSRYSDKAVEREPSGSESGSEATEATATTEPRQQYSLEARITLIPREKQ